MELESAKPERSLSEGNPSKAERKDVHEIRSSFLNLIGRRPQNLKARTLLPLERSESFLQQRAKRKVDLVVAKDEVIETESLMVEEAEEQAQCEWLSDMIR